MNGFFDRPRPNQYEVQYVGDNMHKVSVYNGKTGDLMYSTTTNQVEAESLCDELAAKGYIQRGVFEEEPDYWLDLDDTPELFGELDMF